MTTTPTPRPSTPLLNQKTGLMEKEWFRFISLFFNSSTETAAVVVDNTAQINALTALTTALTALVTTLNQEVSVLEVESVIPPPQNTNVTWQDKEPTIQRVEHQAVADPFMATITPQKSFSELFTPLTPQNPPTHVATRPTTPSVLAGPGAGAAPTVFLSGNDTSMQVTVTTGTAPTGGLAEIATVTYGVQFPTTPQPVFSPANDSAAALTGAGSIFVDGAGAEGFVLTSGTVALADITTYIWNVHTIG